MTYEEAKAIRTKVEQMIEPYERALQALPKGNMGLTLPEYKDEFRALKSSFDYWFKQLQNINKYIVKNFKKENYAERMAQRQARMNKTATPCR